MLTPQIEIKEVDSGMFTFGASQNTPNKLLSTPSWSTHTDRLHQLFPNYLWHDFSPPHLALWDWADAIEPDTTPRPFIALWPRDRGKSTHAEMVAADLGARGKRQYCIYVCETQDQADKHVSTIQHMLESDHVTRHFPEVGAPRIGKHGSRRWRRSIMTAANGYTVEAVGLDKAIRGQKIDWTRPDLIIFDDIDAKHDSELIVKKKEGTITTSVLPSGSTNCAVLFCQNLIHTDSIAHRLSKQPTEPKSADYLANRIISGPFQAVNGLEYEYTQNDEKEIRWVITAGESLWHGFTLQICEDEINREGPTAYELESQHEIDTDNPDALWSRDIINATRVSDHPNLIRVLVAVDPPASTGQCGIIGGGKARLNDVMHGYTLVDGTTPPGASTNTWALAVLRTYHAINASAIVAEVNNGGDMVEATIRQVKLKDENDNVIIDGAHVSIIQVRASRGKEVRAEPVSAVFEQGRGHHVGMFPELEKQLTQWIPGTKPSPDRLDAEVWLYTALGLAGSAELPAQPKPQKSKWLSEPDQNQREGSKWRLS